ncbi:hypothetical protein [Streptomyces sp. NPDC058398]
MAPPPRERKLDAVDDIVAPGVTVTPVGNSYGDFDLSVGRRRR